MALEAFVLRMRSGHRCVKYGRHSKKARLIRLEGKGASQRITWESKKSECLELRLVSDVVAGATTPALRAARIDESRALSVLCPPTGRSLDLVCSSASEALELIAGFRALLLARETVGITKHDVSLQGKRRRGSWVGRKTRRFSALG